MQFESVQDVPYNPIVVVLVCLAGFYDLKQNIFRFALQGCTRLPGSVRRLRYLWLSFPSRISVAEQLNYEKRNYHIFNGRHAGVPVVLLHDVAGRHGLNDASHV